MTGCAPARSNYQKHTNRNLLQRWLLARFHARVAAIVGEVLGRGEGALLLDLGCGEGFVAAYLAQQWPAIRLVGVDVDCGAVGLACGRRAQFVGGDALALPFAERSFDLVICLEVLEHLVQPGLALAEATRVSRGPVLLSVPHQPYFSLANLLRGKNLAQRGDDPDHRHHWSPAEFLALLDERSTVERVVHAFPWLIALVHERKG